MKNLDNHSSSDKTGLLKLRADPKFTEICVVFVYRRFSIDGGSYRNVVCVTSDKKISTEGPTFMHASLACLQRAWIQKNNKKSTEVCASADFNENTGIFMSHL